MRLKRARARFFVAGICAGFFVSLLWLIFLRAEQKQIALTFDDAPNDSFSFPGPELATRLVESLQKAQVAQVAFFANSAKIDSERRNRIELYARSGHLIGNHTHSHPDLESISLNDYKRNFRTADAILRTMPGFVPWFRFTFLNEGEDAHKRDGMHLELERLGYFDAYVTVPTADWFIDMLYEDALANKKVVDLEALKVYYVNHLLRNLYQYDKMAIDLLGRSPPHVILLHENSLAALFIGDFVEALRSRGWKIVSPTVAYDDKIAFYKTKQILRSNPGRIGELALDRGLRGDAWPIANNEKKIEKEFRALVR